MNKIIVDEYKKISELISIGNIKDKSVLVTGANGLIGSYIVDYLSYLNSTRMAGITIYALARSKKKLKTRFKNNNNIQIVEQDLNKPLNFDKKVDYIIHTASNAHPLAFAQDPVGTMKTNLFGTMNLLELTKKSNGKFLYLSTGEIYGNNTDKPFTENDLGIIDTKLVRSCYPESKRAAETLCMAYNYQYGVNVNIARLCYVYGATITDTNSRADAQFLRNALNHENIVIKSEGLQRRTYCYIADCVSGLLKILLEGCDGEVYNISNPISIVSVKEYALTLASIAGVDLIFELPEENERKGYSKPADSILDSTKLQSLGWKPFYNIYNGLKNTMEILKGIKNV